MQPVLGLHVRGELGKLQDYAQTRSERSVSDLTPFDHARYVCPDQNSAHLSTMISCYCDAYV